MLGNLVLANILSSMSTIEVVDGILTPQKPVKSLSEYIDVVRELSIMATENLWFRGHAKYSYQNLPSIYRTSSWLTKVYDFGAEFGALKKFKRQSKISRDNNFEYLHLLQHHGFPTRLLDWTESSLIGLFFAIHSKSECESPVVWALNPFMFNFSTQRISDVLYFFGKANNHSHFELKCN